MHSTALPRRKTLVSILICGVVSLGGASCVVSSDSESGFTFRVSANTWGDLHHSATEERRHALDVQPGETLVLEGFNGDMVVRANDGEPGELIGVIRADGKTQADAEALLAGAKMEVHRSGSEVRVTLTAEPRELVLDKGVTVSLFPTADARAVIPEGVRVRIPGGNGKIEITGPFADVEARTNYGEVSISHVKGRAEAVSGSGRIEIRGVTGDVIAETDFGDVSIERVEGASKVIVESSSGDVSLRDVIAGRIEAVSSFGEVELESVQGEVAAETASGQVEMLDAAVGPYRLHSNFGSVTAKRFSGKLEASSDSGRVLARGDGSVEAISGFGEVEIEGVLREVSAESSSGSVTVIALRGSEVAESWRISSDFGRVEIRLPKDTSCTIEANTDFGDIEDEFGLVIDEDGSGGSADGKIGEGGQRIVLSTSHGDVVIRRED